MKRCWLQVSLPGRSPERLAASCKGAEHLLGGAELFVSDSGDGVKVWLLFGTWSDFAGSAAAQVVSVIPSEKESLPTVYMPTEYVRRLAEMPKAQIRLFEIIDVDEEQEHGTKLAEAEKQTTPSDGSFSSDKDGESWRNLKSSDDMATDESLSIYEKHSSSGNLEVAATASDSQSDKGDTPSSSSSDSSPSEETSDRSTQDEMCADVAARQKMISKVSSSTSSESVTDPLVCEAETGFAALVRNVEDVPFDESTSSRNDDGSQTRSRSVSHDQLRLSPSSGVPTNPTKLTKTTDIPLATPDDQAEFDHPPSPDVNVCSGNHLSPGAASDKQDRSFKVAPDDDGQVTSSPKKSYASVVAEAKNPSTRATRADVERTKPGTNENGVVRFFKGAKDFVCEAVGIKPKTPVLYAVNDWDGFGKAVIWITQQCRDHGDSWLMEIMDQLEKLLRGENCCMEQLTLAVFVVQKGGAMAEKLQPLVLKRTSSLQLVRNEIGLSKISSKFRLSSIKPHLVWNEFFAQLVKDPHPPKLEVDDPLLVKIIAILDDCGLFRRKFDPSLWQGIRFLTRPGFFISASTALSEYIEAQKVTTLGVLLQPGLPELAAFVTEVAEIPRSQAVPVHCHAADYIQHLMKQECTARNARRRSFHDIVDACFLTLDFVQFSRKEAVLEIISCLVRVLSFHALGTFQHYNELIPVIRSKHKHAETLKGVLLAGLNDDFLNPRELERKPTAWHVSSFLSSEAGYLLSFKAGEQALRRFTTKLMKDGTSFESKLLFLGELYDKFVNEQWASNTDEFESYLLDSIKEARCGSKPRAATLKSAFCVAADSPSIFCIDGKDKAFLGQVSKLLCSVDDCQTVLRCPTILDGMRLNEAEQRRECCLHALLQDRLHQLLTCHCGDFDLACRFFVATFAEKMPPCTRRYSLGVDVFSAYFSRWNPEKIEDFIDLPLESLLLFRECFSARVQGDGRQQMDKTFEHVKGIVVHWVQQFESEALTKETLERLKRNEISGCWHVIGEITSQSLPAISQLQKSYSDYCELEQTILEMLQGSDDISVVAFQRIFKGYNCDKESNTPMHRLLREYDRLLMAEENRNRSDLKGCSSTIEEKTLFQVRNECEAVLSFRDTHAEALILCDYFLKHPSVLFHSELLKEISGNPTLESLVVAAKCAKESLLSIFSDEGNFADVSRVFKTACAGESTVELEVDTLLLCDELGLSPERAESFLVVAVLSEVSEPLALFTTFCRQFVFEAATEDPSFGALLSFSQDLSQDSAQSYSLRQCLDCSKQLCELLGVESDRSAIDWAKTRQAMKSRLPVLELLGCLSLHGEVWTFARDMKWFGPRGLKRFYEQYENLTNVLLGNTASYEMSVLDAVGPTIRVVSAIGGMCEEATVVDLLDKLSKHRDIVAFHGSSSGLADIRQVQTNLSLIRDWFTVGVDEIAAFHGIFDAVCKTGEYLLFPPKFNETEHPCTDGSGATLTLQYTTSKNGVPELYQLQGDELAGFVQQIALIQQENETIAASVNAFVEQHKILSRAASNVIYMRSLGFVESHSSTFRCMVGGEDINEARDIQLKSDASLKNCQFWLDQVRLNHSVSLLFSMEELREIHKVIRGTESSSDVSTAVEYKVTFLLSRLAPYNALHQERTSTICQAIELWKVARLPSASSSWLVDVSVFLDSLHQSFESPWQKSLSNNNSTQSQIILHTLACNAYSFRSLSLRVLIHVYKERLPQDFEILDGSMHCTSEKISVFLERVQTFRTNTFAIVNVEALDGGLFEKVLSFLSDPGIAQQGIRLHLIQRGSMLHTSPWIRGTDWDSDDIDGSTDSWKSLVLDNAFIESVSLVWSPRTGAGKTRYIQQQLSMSYEVAKITIHEGSSVTSIAQDLATKFSNSDETKAVHFNLANTFDGTVDECTNWAESLNQFFFSLLVLRSVRSPNSSFQLGESRWRIFIECPSRCVESTSDSVTQWFLENVPIVMLCGTILSPPNDFAIDDETRRVCTYLRAYENGTINRKFEAGRQRRILLVLDKSGSMMTDWSGSTVFNTAIENALRIFDKHIAVGDIFGFVLFDHLFEEVLPAQLVTDEPTRLHMRRILDNARHLYHGGGTNMYTALRHVLASVHRDNEEVETWIVCLTDGQSADSHELVRPCLEHSRENVHLIVVGVNLCRSLETHMRLMCHKYGMRPEPCKGFFVRSEEDIASMNFAFDAVSRSLPVSKTFELDGRLSDDDCRRFLRNYIPDVIDPNDMLLTSFWVQFIYRRVRVFDDNECFNYNVSCDSMGSTLMRTMLEEVQRLIVSNHSVDWIERDHRQLIYDFTRDDAPEFRLLCTAPDEMDEKTRRELNELGLPGFSIPTGRQMQQRSTLDLFLSQALKVPLDNGRLKCVDEQNFILTLDFTMKLLNIHERVACHTPCVIEGETGVSKTALTKMYAVLQNAAVKDNAKRLTDQHLDDIVQEMIELGYDIPEGPTSHERLEHGLVLASESVIGNETSVARALQGIMLEKCATRPNVCRDVPVEYDVAEEGRTKSVVEFLSWFRDSALEPLFFDVNIDSSLTEADIVGRFEPVRRVARKCPEAVVVAFLDEFNTSSVMGLCKEIIIDRTLAGQSLEDNIVVIGACNPARKQVVRMAHSRLRDLGREWASGHYQVATLPPSIGKIKWSFGSLNHNQEKEFILRRLEIIEGEKLPRCLRIALTEFISESQEAMRKFAIRNISDGLLRENGVPDESEATLVTARARSVVSLRDIQRVFCLYEFFSSSLDIPCIVDAPDVQKQRRSMLLAIATVYYLRLDGTSRAEYLDMTGKLPTERGEKTGLLSVLNEAMDEIIRETQVPQGIAITRGVRENIFMTFVCTLSRTPLMIVGPPGSSKTLSVNVVADNANGEDSSKEFYRNHARLSLFHYQCSKQSTSKELLAVFDKATQRQNRTDPSKHRCFVLMDEAGLPEEEKESLKVLHYLLEGHMSVKAQVGFVAISNHVLDAAKSNRCIMLLREEPDEHEMLSISRGVLFDTRADGHSKAHHVDLAGKLIAEKDFALSLCRAYRSILHDDGTLCWFRTFFGLRDFIHFLMAVRSVSLFDTMRMSVPLQQFVHAVERNFNGVPPNDLRHIAEVFLKSVLERRSDWSASLLAGAFRDPMHVIRDALLAPNDGSSLSRRTRYKLIIDCSEDDSILRMLSLGGLVDVSRRSMFKLSRMPEEQDLEELRVISSVKFAALQGNLVVLSQTESINESFYDLFNQRFQAVTERDGGTALYTNIAVGGISRRSRVQPEFECVIHVKQSDMEQLPAPFLNRFEKYRLTISDVLRSRLTDLGYLSTIFMQSKRSTSQLISILGESGLMGWTRDCQTVDSIFVDMLSLTSVSCVISGMDEKERCLPASAPGSKFDCIRDVADCLVDFVRNIGDLRPSLEDAYFVIETAVKILPVEDAESLRMTVTKGGGSGAISSAFQSIVLSRNDNSQESRICRILVQMLVTRLATRRIVQLATPESIFAARTCIPDVVLTDYFQQYHFSLRSLIGYLSKSAQQSSRTKLVLVSTRSDSSIRSIPSHGIEGSSALKESSSVERLRRMVHEDVDGLVVQHLSLLKSEAMLRSVIESWTKNCSKRVLLMLVDMSKPNATESTNYTRICVEQHIGDNSGKTFLLLLHYAPSCPSHSFYPVRFLGGWEHYFLDGVGSENQSIGIEHLIEAACRSDGDANRSQRMNARICDALSILLPRVIRHLASRRLFYPHQGGRGEDSFSCRTNMLRSIMGKNVGDRDIATILCAKFAELWADHALLSTMERATQQLILGTTQLPLTMSMESVLADTFDAFLTIELTEMNQWRNLDILLDAESEEIVTRLYGLILDKLPVVPFEELVLQIQSQSTQLSPLADPRKENSTIHFPFFRMVSSFIDECIEKAEQTLCEERGGGTELSILEEKLLLETIKILREQASCDESSGDHGRVPSKALAVLTAITFTEEQDEHCNSLFHRYLKNFIEWEVGCHAHHFMVDWIMKKVCCFHCSRNLVAVHVAAKLRGIEMIKVASMLEVAHCLSLPGKLEAENDDAAVQFANTGEDMFAQLLEYFERNVDNDATSSRQWSASFSLFIQQIHAMLAGTRIEDDRVACRLRALCFYNILIESLALTQAGSAEIWNGRSTMSVEEWKGALSMYSFLRSVRSTGFDSRRTEDLTLRLFFSPLWLKITHVFLEKDFDFVVQHIAEGGIEMRQRQLALMLLHQGCFAHPQNGTETSRPFLSHVGGSYPLSLLNDRIACAQASAFASDGARVCIPHYVPEWLRKEGADPDCRIVSDFEYSAFLTSFVHCYECELSRLAFEMFLQIHLPEAEEASSETLFAGLLQAVHAEVSIDRLEHTRLSRSRRAGEHSQLQGSPLGAIILHVRLLCFVAKVAYEVSVNSNTTALCGVYADEACSLLEALMALTHLKWQEFFMWTILRVGGEGTLATVLRETRELRSMDWCQPWLLGIGGQMNDAAQSLKAAEDAMADALREEEQKSREMRLCPHCRQPFIVYAMNCGHFICGRDNYGFPVGHGCGQHFNVHAAARYESDDSLLSPLRVRVADELRKFREHEHASSRWDDARTMTIPSLSFKLEQDLSRVSLLPASVLTGHVDPGIPNGAMSLINILIEGSTKIAQFAVLPDLVELYMWLHFTFKYLVSKEQAYQLKIADVMTHELLRQRFDAVSAPHIAALWKRASAGVNMFLRDAGNKVRWDCEEIRIEFDKLEDAPLVALLSEGEHPTDGNDILFLLINEIIGSYNNFIRRLVLCANSRENHVVKEREVPPKFVSSGCGGAILMGAAVPLPVSELDMIVASFWDEQEHAFDLENLEAALRRDVGLHGSLPVFSNPLLFLRERFRFRDDMSRSVVDAGTQVSVYVGQAGEYFANQQDFNLAHDVRKSLLALDMIVADTEIRRTLSDNFHSFDYSQLRLMLEGCRSLLATVSMEFKVVCSVGQCLRDSGATDDTAEALRSFGFPAMDHTHVELLDALNSAQFVELVSYLSYQLASEAYLLAHLPLCMTDPLRDIEQEALTAGLSNICDEVGSQKAVSLIDGFTRDVLSFYENQIRAAVSSGRSFKRFLVESNFCDEAMDPVFALLPSSVSLRNFVSLKQFLHQRKLSILQSDPGSFGKDKAIGRTLDRKTLEIFTRPSRGRCWLWEGHDKTETDETPVDEVVNVSSLYNEKWGLWFESVLSGTTSDHGLEKMAFDDDAEMALHDEAQTKKESQIEGVILTEQAELDMEIDDGTIAMDIEDGTMQRERNEKYFAGLLQSWWRRRRSRLDNAQLFFDAMEDFGDIDEFEDSQFLLDDDDEHILKPHRSDVSQQRPVTATAPESGENISCLYGAQDAVDRMRDWLNGNRLPQEIGDNLVELGVRDIDDVVELVDFQADLLAGLKPLDRAKLEKAVAVYRSASKET